MVVTVERVSPVVAGVISTAAEAETPVLSLLRFAGPLAVCLFGCSRAARHSPLVVLLVALEARRLQKAEIANR